MNQKSGERTLLASVILSSPGPIVVGIGLFLGRSSTQLADFIRRTAELAAIIVSWVIYKVTNNNSKIDTERNVKLENIANLCVGIAMLFSGIAMSIVAFLTTSAEKGNVIPGLIIAVLGVTTNSWFWLRYSKLNRLNPNAILAVQSRLYRAKSLVDGCVTIALITVAVSPASVVAYYMDIGGSIVVSLYLIINGVMIITGKQKSKSEI